MKHKKKWLPLAVILGVVMVSLACSINFGPDTTAVPPTPLVVTATPESPTMTPVVVVVTATPEPTQPTVGTATEVPTKVVPSATLAVVATATSSPTALPVTVITASPTTTPTVTVAPTMPITTPQPVANVGISVWAQDAYFPNKRIEADIWIRRFSDGATVYQGKPGGFSIPADQLPLKANWDAQYLPLFSAVGGTIEIPKAVNGVVLEISLVPHLPTPEDKIAYLEAPMRELGAAGPRIRSTMCIRNFAGGQMVWYKPESLPAGFAPDIYAVYNPTSSGHTPWTGFEDLWDQQPYVYEGPPPPAGQFVPNGGIGKLWTENYIIQGNMKFSTEPSERCESANPGPGLLNYGVSAEFDGAGVRWLPQEQAALILWHNGSWQKVLFTATPGISVITVN